MQIQDLAQMSKPLQAQSVPLNQILIKSLTVFHVFPVVSLMTTVTDSMLVSFPPMGVYDTLFKFKKAAGVAIGSTGTHPWAQGYPLTTQMPGGPEMPTSINFTANELMHPGANGDEVLLSAIRDYYNTFYGSNITNENIAVFGGGRPAVYATLALLKPSAKILIEETEYTPFWDALKLLDRNYAIIPSNPDNKFIPTVQDYRNAKIEGESVFIVKSNPCNPTGVTWSGDSLRDLVAFSSEDGNGALFDEADEFFNSTPVSALQYVNNIDNTNIFVISCATKGLQAPGLRVGWVIASKANIEVFRNFSSISMGGVSFPSQLCTAKLLDLDRVRQARLAVGAHYEFQRQRYGAVLTALGCELFTGSGGIYQWVRLPAGLSGEQFNQLLVKHKAAILPGHLCDMLRRNEASPHYNFIRFSFGPLKVEAFDEDMKVLTAVLTNSI